MSDYDHDDTELVNELVDGPSRPTYPVTLTQAEIDALLDPTVAEDDDPDDRPIYCVSLTEWEIERLLARLDD